MKDNIFADTSAWIASFRVGGNLALKEYLRTSLDLDRLVTTNIVILELLQGCKTRREYEVLKARMDVLPLYLVNENTWSIAYETEYSLRRKGITVPIVDILICSIALEHGLNIVHHDEHIKVVARELDIPSIDFLKN